MKSLVAALAAALISSAIAPSSAMAGPAADALSTCLSDNTTGKERKEMARWVFLGMSVHPDIQSLSKVTAADREAADRMMAALLTRLLTESCRAETKSAMETEGSASFQAAFSGIGELAMKELLSDPGVNASFSNFAKFVDAEKMKTTLQKK